MITKYQAERILGLAGNYNEKQLHEAFRKSARAAHPDAGGSEDSFKSVNEANSYLTDVFKTCGSEYIECDLSDIQPQSHICQSDCESEPEAYSDSETDSSEPVEKKHVHSPIYQNAVYRVIYAVAEHFPYRIVFFALCMFYAFSTFGMLGNATPNGMPAVMPSLEEGMAGIGVFLLGLFSLIVPVIPLGARWLILNLLDAVADADGMMGA